MGGETHVVKSFWAVVFLVGRPFHPLAHGRLYIWAVGRAVGLLVLVNLTLLPFPATVHCAHSNALVIRKLGANGRGHGNSQRVVVILIPATATRVRTRAEHGKAWLGA